jgi:RNA polymerase sigma factor (sigma-70 family)
MPTALDLFERHHVAVFRFLRRMELSAPDAEDLTQEVFLRVLRTVGSYEERQLERAWVFRIARNVWLDHWRARRRAPLQVPFSEPDAGTTGATPIDGLALDQALAQLGDGEREAFVMREVAGLGYVEIAEATGATPDAVRSRIHRARLALRKVLGEGQALVAANRALEK